MTLQVPPEVGFDVPLPTTSDMAAGGTLLPIDYVSQGNMLNLCWAACCEMVLRANGATSKKICEIAQMFAGAGVNCCTGQQTCAEVCDQPYATPEQAYQTCNVGLCDPNSPYQFPFSMQGVTTEIAQNGRPVEIYFLWDGGAAAHLALAIGVNSDGMLYMNDPHYGRGWVAYEDVLTAYSYGGAWRQTWQGIGHSLGPLS